MTHRKCAGSRGARHSSCDAEPRFFCLCRGDAERFTPADASPQICFKGTAAGCSESMLFRRALKDFALAAASMPAAVSARVRPEEVGRASAPEEEQAMRAKSKRPRFDACLGVVLRAHRHRVLCAAPCSRFIAKIVFPPAMKPGAPEPTMRCSQL